MKRDARQKRREARAKQRQEIAEKKRKEEDFKRNNPTAWAAKQKKLKESKNKDTEFKQPPLLGLLTRLFRGVKFEFKNIHIRYEDDIFSGTRPFSFGFTIQHIKMDNHEEEEKRQRAQE